MISATIFSPTWETDDFGVVDERKNLPTSGGFKCSAYCRSIHASLEFWTAPGPLLRRRPYARRNASPQTPTNPQATMRRKVLQLEHLSGKAPAPTSAAKVADLQPPRSCLTPKWSGGRT